MDAYRGVQIYETHHVGAIGAPDEVELRAPMVRVLDRDEVEAAGRDPRKTESYRDDVTLTAKKPTKEKARRAIEQAIDEYRAAGFR